MILDPNQFYKRDIGIEVNGSSYEGVVTIPHARQYELIFYPKGDTDLLLLRTCHREYAAEKLSSGWFSKNKFKYTYIPVPGIEDVRVCPLRLDVYESSKGRHSWAMADFESPDHTVDSTLTCNGAVNKIHGVGVCQAKKDTVQRIQFDEPIRFAPVKPDGCSVPVKFGAAYEIKASLGECLYYFDTKGGAVGRLTIIGYDGIAIRSGQ